MKERLANALTAILALCAVTITVLVARREFVAVEAPGQGVEVTAVAEWRQYTATGHRAGPAEAALTVVEFSDFQCPFCAESARDLASVQAQFPDDLAVVYRHFPLQSHAHAFTAALAAECAGEQGRFRAFHDLLYAKQDSLGMIEWTSLARSVGVRDVARFADCLESERFRGRVEQDMADARRLGVRGTPTYLVNGRLVRGSLDSASWAAWVSKAVRERPAVAGS